MDAVLKKEWFNTKITWLEKIRLCFKPKMIAVDLNQDQCFTISYKKLNGKIYFLEKKQIKGE
jgi:hypothetical protein